MALSLAQTSQFNTTYYNNPPLAFGSNNTAHNVLALTVWVNYSGTPTVTDTRGNTWTAVGASQISNGSATWSWAFVCTDCAAGANTVTVNDGSNLGSITGLYEITGWTGTPTVENFNKKASALASDTTASITPTAANSISIAHAQCGSNAGCSVGTGGFSTPGNGAYGRSAYLLQSSAAAAQCQFTSMSASNGLLIFDIADVAAATYSISGNAGVASATVAWTGTASGSTSADGSGNYTIPSLANGSYTVTPSKTGYSFSPTNSAQTVSGSNITGVDFTATPSASKIVVVTFGF